MIQEQTILKISDNSGAKVVWCIKIIGNFKKKYAKTGDIIVVSIQCLWKKLKKNSKVKKKEVYKAFILKTKYCYKYNTGIMKIFKQNTAILLDKQNNPIGTRILGIVPNIFKRKNFQKFISISAGIF